MHKEREWKKERKGNEREKVGMYERKQRDKWQEMNRKRERDERSRGHTKTGSGVTTSVDKDKFTVKCWMGHS